MSLRFRKHILACAWLLVIAPTVCAAASLPEQDEVIPIATFDSGFGGFFTAKSIEAASRELQQRYGARFSVTHYGDTLNAPYGEKNPEQIAQFATQGIFQAFKDGAQEVFIACNTASTQYERIGEILDARQPGLSKNTVSIVGSSVAELKRQIDTSLQTRSTVRVGILATPATVRAQTYPKALAQAFGVDLPSPKMSVFDQPRWYTAKGKQVQSVNYAVALHLSGGRVLEIYQVAPANWVDMIEHGAPAPVQREAVERDLRLLTSEWKRSDAQFAWDVVGEFCTHYPVFDSQIRQHALAQGLARSETAYIQQGPLDKSYAQKLRSTIDLTRASHSADIKPDLNLPQEGPQTTHYSVMDQNGGAVSVTTTINLAYGGGRSVDGAGFLLNNIMDDFSGKPGAPNAFGLVGGKANEIEPGKRPLSSMTPTIVYRDGKPFFVTGSPGGSTIITVVLQTMLNVLEFGMNVAEAEAAPRIHHQWLPDTVVAEKDIPVDTLNILRGRGFVFDAYRVGSDRVTVLGRTNSIEFQNHFFYGSSDPRGGDPGIAPN